MKLKYVCLFTVISFLSGYLVARTLESPKSVLPAKLTSASTDPVPLDKSSMLVARARKRARPDFSLSPILYTYNKDSFRQTISWSGTDLSGYEVIVENYDKYLQEEFRFEYSAALKIVDIASQGRDVFFILFEASSGAQVIEKWRHVPKKFQLPQGPIAYRMKKTAVYSGVDLGVILDIEVDPYGGFLLISNVNPSHQVTQMELGTGMQLATLLDSTTHPELDNGVFSMHPVEHQVEGILWIVILDQPSAFAGILRDPDGDSILDDWQTYDEQTMDSVYPAYYWELPWVNNFVSYPSAD